MPWPLGTQVITVIHWVLRSLTVIHWVLRSLTAIHWVLRSLSAIHGVLIRSLSYWNKLHARGSA